MSANTEQNQAPIINVDFSHRLSVLGNNLDPYNLNCSISEMAIRATSVLRMISCEFCKEEDEDRMADEIIYFSIDSAINEVEDMRRTVDAFFKAHRSQEGNKQT